MKLGEGNLSGATTGVRPTRPPLQILIVLSKPTSGAQLPGFGRPIHHSRVPSPCCHVIGGFGAGGRSATLRRAASSPRKSGETHTTTRPELPIVSHGRPNGVITALRGYHATRITPGLPLPLGVHRGVRPDAGGHSLRSQGRPKRGSLGVLLKVLCAPTRERSHTRPNFD